jgi:DNA-binding PadR family transcriptional regulator
MDINNLCLGALSLCEASGYEIKKMFESSFSHFQAISFGSIYPALARLSDQGLVTYREETQEKRPTKKVFNITDAGRKQFLANLTTTEPAEQHRSDFLMLMMFAHLLPAERLEEIMQTQIDQLQTELKTLLEATGEHGELTPGMRFTIEYGITAYSAVLELTQQRRAQLLKEITQAQGATPCNG